VGIGDEEAATAVLLSDLAEQRVIEVTVGARPAVLLYKSGTASALDSTAVEEGRDIGATGVFEPLVDGRRLTFEPVGGGFRDRETASTWNILGEATAGSLSGSRLPPVVHVDTFWFAWSTFLPDTELAGAPS